MNFVSLCLSVPFEFPYNVFVFLLFFIFKCDLFFRAALVVSSSVFICLL